MQSIFGQFHEMSVLITTASSEGSGESALMRRIARALAVRIHKVRIVTNAQTFNTSCFAGYFSTGVYWSYLPKCSKCTTVTRKKTKKMFSRPIIALCRLKYRRMLQKEHSAIHSTFIKLPVVTKIFVLSILSCRFTQVFLYWHIWSMLYRLPYSLPRPICTVRKNDMIKLIQ